MVKETFDVVIPLFKTRWNTRAVLEGLTRHYSPRSIHIVMPAEEAAVLKKIAKGWTTAPLQIHPEENFFQPIGLTKDAICAELDLEKSLYTPGWFYQQLLKLGAYEAIPDLSEWYLVWDSDLLPVGTWPIFTEEGETLKHTFALLQHNKWGNPRIVANWATWIETVLDVPAATDTVGTFIPHHMWLRQTHLRTFAERISEFFKSEDHWLRLMIRSANQFKTFGEYWCYSSWVASKAPEDLSFHPYGAYGATTERFFDDGTGLFSVALRRYLKQDSQFSSDAFSPSYAEIYDFVREAYGENALPSSLSFESSPRHLKKDEETMHIEEVRSRWNPRNIEAAAV